MSNKILFGFHAVTVRLKTAPRSVFLDIDYSSLSTPFDDAALELALNRPRDFPVILRSRRSSPMQR